MNSPFLTFLARGSLAVILVASGVVACSSSPPASNESDEKTATTSDALTITGLFPTGVNDQGELLASGAIDPHYTLSSTDPACPGPNAIVANLSQVTTAWTTNTAASEWISCSAAGLGAANTNFTYTTSFILPVGVPPSTATLRGRWACDNYCSIVVNGRPTGVVSQNPNFGAPSDFVVSAETASFRAGINTVQFVATSVSSNEGLQILAISVTAGCTVDSDCGTGTFCNTQSQACVPQLDNGVPVPTIPGHTPDLDGMCTPDASAIVCASGGCDTADDLCGFYIGHACTTNSQCRSNECDPTTNLCIPDCTVDSDCEAGNFCNNASHLCMPQLADGEEIPTIVGHTPPLDGTCTPEVGALVCRSGVCDIGDNLCGFELGHPCTANPECRSDNCNLETGFCEPSLPCCGNTYGMEMGADAGKCIICDDAGVPVDAGKDASADAAPDSGSNVANGSDNTVQDPQGSGGNNPTGSGGNGVSASGGGGCQMGGGASNPGLGMISGLLAMIAAAWRRRQKTVQG